MFTHLDSSLHPSSSVSLVVSVPLSSGVNLPSHTSTASITPHHQIGNIKSFPSIEQQQQQVQLLQQQAVAAAQAAVVQQQQVKEILYLKFF